MWAASPPTLKAILLVPKVRIGGAEPYPTYKLEALTYLFKRHLAIVAKQRDYFYGFVVLQVVQIYKN
ncbi:hypothetical protein B9G53_22900 [Pseudanabaena sp. SR411]|nr:hypothetical protein B9G53_22900 [Pseudanabaena sp. SR411]